MRSRNSSRKVKKKGFSKEGLTKTSSSKKKGGGSDEEHKSARNRTDDREEDDEHEDDIQWQTDTSLEAARQHVQEQLNTVTAAMVMLSTDEKEKGSKATSSSAVDESMVNDGESIHEKLVEDMKASLDKGISVNKFQSLLSSFSGSPLEVMIALYEALFAGIDKGFAKEVAEKKNCLAAAVAQSEGSQLLLL